MNSAKQIDENLNQEVIKKTDAIIKVGAITAGTQLGTTVLHTMAKNPVFLFGLGLVTGIIINKNRKQIIASASYLSKKGKQLITKDED
ncbi:MAG: hypothetical protein WAX77_05520 [Methylococcaceae bacterium]